MRHVRASNVGRQVMPGDSWLSCSKPFRVVQSSVAKDSDGNFLMLLRLFYDSYASYNARDKPWPLSGSWVLCPSRLLHP